MNKSLCTHHKKRKTFKNYFCLDCTYMGKCNHKRLQLKDVKGTLAHMPGLKGL